MLRRILPLVLICMLLFTLFTLPVEDASAQTPPRIFGSDRYATAVKISQAGWLTAETVVLARGDAFPDALAGTPLAYKLDAPILLTRSARLDEQTKNEITRLEAKAAIILGGMGAISQDVENELAAMGLEVKRIGGSDRYETAKLIAEELGATTRAVIAFGGNFPDALAIAPYAARNGIPILLSRTDRLPDKTREALLGITETIVVGGESVISEAVMDQLPAATRIGGANRYDTTAKIIEELDMPTDAVYVATGTNFADALTGSVLSAKNTASVLLVHTDRVPLPIKNIVSQKNITNFTILGGESAVSAATVEELTEVRAPAEMYVHFIDVGQGDAILIETPGGKTILIDAGTRTAGQKVVAYLAEAGITSIDVLIGTHPHADHIGGLITVLEEVDVRKVIDSGIPHTTVTYYDYLTIIDQKDIPFEVGRAGQSIHLDPALSIKIIHPGNDAESLSLNNASVMVKLIYNEIGFMFTGDAEGQAENQMLARGYDLSRINVLKVGHHGSSSSTTQAFLDALSPSSAVIQSGAGNTYGHPHEEVLQRLYGAGVDVYRNDVQGDIVVATDGHSYRFHVDPVPDGGHGGPGPGVRVNINTAGFEELQQIIHIGPERALEIIDLRPFDSLDGLLQVSGIGPSRLQDIKDEGIAYVE